MARRAKGEGSLYQARGKSWVYQYNENGARKTRRKVCCLSQAG